MPAISRFKIYARSIWWGLWLMSSMPFLILIFQWYEGSLGVNPLQNLQSRTGNVAFLFLIITLAITPTRHYMTELCRKVRSADGKRLVDWNWLMKTRRMFGMYCFFYASLHLSIYLYFDLALEWQWLLSDIEEKPYIVVGMLAMLMLIPLALTSTNGMMRLLGKNWRKLHRLIYIIAILTTIHYWWLSKVGVYDAWSYSLAVFLLLFYRILIKVDLISHNPQDDGMETEGELVPASLSVDRRKPSE